MNYMVRRQIFVASFLAVFLALSGASAAPVPSEIKSTVAFVYIQGADGELKPNGTGFFVGVPNPKKSDDFSVYFVTAKHLIQLPDRKSFRREVFIRINTKEGGSQTGRLTVVNANGTLAPYIPDDESVDLAVFPFFPDPSRFDAKFLPVEMVTTKEDYESLGIREGSDVFFTGLFSPYPGAARNYPIVRFGRVALVTDEKIDWNGTPTELYLLESGSYGGNSGAPVFFYLGSDRSPGRLTVGDPVIKLAGVMQGAFLDFHPLRIVETGRIPIAPSNMGISAVVPAYKLHELLYSQELLKQRGF